ncbi:aminodeoxychorismate lyase [Pseudoalteromonas sp. BDTF-M6]|uniref:aminodeoxychorismate lyase n=1 Tax=Pseudoalteromonas sp. BDTF-M6 TaxID=2796132 RepID=UPI001BAFB9CF|nr:aminodeoxychorismate lyase [Pseudoalteromonas sp. BDTF-M6]MBS3798724.1 aminodeoxychorismate lyase [Pseudoalteromonas sp. BDTF-M6]
MTKTIINGQPGHLIDIKDRGLNYGDGFFTTAKVVDGQVQLWPLHRARLSECARRLGFGELDFVALEQDVTQLLGSNQALAEEPAVLKVLYTRGSGGRGYAPPSDVQPTRVLSLLPYPSAYQGIAQKGLSLSVAKTRLAQQPLLAGLKTLNRLEQVFIKQEAAQQSSDDLLVLDTTDKVIETSSANLLMYKQGQWYTPSLEQAGIQGVYLTHLQQRLPIISCQLNLAQVLSMDAVFCCNSLMELVPITRIAYHDYNLDVALSLLVKQGIKV